MRILALDTATEACSAALCAGSRVFARLEQAPRRHAELILPMVEQVLAEAELLLGDLDAIAFGRGPGSFTGVRLAASVAQGLAFAASRPVIPVSTLAAVALEALRRDPDAAGVLACNDARMGEVYWCAFERGPHGLPQPVGPERVGPAAAVQWPAAAERGGWLGAGQGFVAQPLLAERWAGLGAVLADILPSAQAMLPLARRELAAGMVLPPREAVPVYLRDDVARPLSHH